MKPRPLFQRPKFTDAFKVSIVQHLETSDEWLRIPDRGTDWSRAENAYRWIDRVTAHCDVCGHLYVRRSLVPFEPWGDVEPLPRLPCGHEPSHPKRYPPHGWTPPPPRRLPLYGETPDERRIRDLQDSWRFGQWLCDHDEEWWDLMQEIDGYEDPSLCSLHDVERNFGVFSPARDGDGDEEEDGGEEDDEDGPAWRRDELARARRAYLRAEGVSVSALADDEHRCHVDLSALPPPHFGGVYFVMTAAPVPSAPARVKIGWAKTSIAKRIRELGAAHPWQLHVLAWIEGAPIAEESAQHERFKDLRIHDVPGKEWFELRDDLLHHVRRLRMEITSAVRGDSASAMARASETTARA